MSHVLVSPLNWGLGHATRDIPVIKNLLDHHHEVTIAACGNARSVLEQEFPGCRTIDFPDYPVSFSGSRFFLPKFVASFPLILKAISAERKHLELILAKDHYDLIISDNRLGIYSSEIPSVFITHQLHYHLPLVFWPAELLAVALNGFHHGKYRHIVVPDNPSTQTALAGKLSRPGADATKRRVYFSGILTSIRKRDREEDLDYLVMVSGPEPQRTRLQEILLDQIPAIEGKRVILLGSPGDHALGEQSDTCRIIPYASTREKEELMNRAQFIICRSGYTSMMEIAELGKQHALFIPTPGQTEQEYLSWYYENKGWFHSQNQYDLHLPHDIRVARKPGYTGFPDVPKTEENVTRLYEKVFAQYLER
jgi:UDP:flavonoid glycosyltransferase YjiC (YdhE family)